MTADFSLFDHTVLLTRAGSRAYGTALPTSDIDLKGVVLPPVEYRLGLKVFEQADKPSDFTDRRWLDLLSREELAAVASTKLEGSLYSVSKFMRLALIPNPNVLDTLWCRDADVLKATPAGERLREIREAFLHIKLKDSFAGYAFEQLRRLKGHRRWLTDPSAQSGPAYEHWLKTRNPDRAALEAKHGYDTKHAMHLVRLLRMCHETLLTGQVNVWRGDRDAEELVAIRNGAWSYEQLIEWAERQDGLCRELVTSGQHVLPLEPDLAKVHEVVLAILQS